METAYPTQSCDLAHKKN